MSNLEKWIKAILNEDADNLSIGSVRTLQMIKHEFERLQRQVADLETQSAKEVKEKSPVDGTPYVNLNPINKVEEEKKSAEEILKKHLEIAKNPSQWPEKYKLLKLYNPYVEAMVEYKFQSSPNIKSEKFNGLKHTQVSDELTLVEKTYKQVNVEEAAEAYANDEGYPKSDKEHFETTYWTQHNIYVKGFKKAIEWQIPTI